MLYLNKTIIPRKKVKNGNNLVLTDNKGIRELKQNDEEAFPQFVYLF
jgi:hypothetical protein